jgi:uncharacterized SAM-binding protein YcdF (DUF218 family)/cyclophilin family peptidyl-prolyl cis-trans isomerase
VPPPHRAPDGACRAIVVLGCSVQRDESGALATGALARRIEVAARMYAGSSDAHAVVVVSGGRRWGGVVEADAMADELARRGVPRWAIVRERCSMTTRENARFVAAVLARRGLDGATLVTSEWHLRRATAHFDRAGVRTCGVPVPDPPHWRGPSGLWRDAREWLLRLALSCALGCGSPQASGAAAAEPEGGAVVPPVSEVLLTIARAEDRRDVLGLPGEALGHSDAVVRRAFARAVARILGPEDAPLLRALSDEDEEVVSFAGLGLGESCKGRQEAHVRALAARLVGVASAGAGAGRAVSALLRAVGRCGGDLAVATLLPWLREAPPAAEAAAFALADAAALAGEIPLPAGAALLDAAQGATPLDAALAGFGRDVRVPPELIARLVAAAREALGRPGPSRIFAVRAAGGSDGVALSGDLAGLLLSDSATLTERIEAVRVLARWRPLGLAALGRAVQSMASGWPGAAASENVQVLVAAIGAIGTASLVGPDDPTAALWSLARWEPAPGSPGPLLRRASLVRCAAAARLARGAWNADVLRRCDIADGASGERARFIAVDRGPWIRGRRDAWSELARSQDAGVRSQALEAIGRHPELGDGGRRTLVAALGDASPRIVGAAADVLQKHPDRALARSPGEGVDPEVAGALRGAIVRDWPVTAAETRATLIDAAVALSLAEAPSLAQRACKDPIAAVRSRAANALAALGDPGASCQAPGGLLDAAPEVGHALGARVRLHLDTEAGALSIVLDPALSPVAVTRVAALARAGFYDGLRMHVASPGWAVRFGDASDRVRPDAEPRPLRCEIAPAPFEPLDVGLARVARDVATTELMVVLARSPELDGQTAWLGKAEGGWTAVVEGDAILGVHVDP